MDEKKLYNLLKFIFNRLEGVDPNWRLDGSANLLVQGIDLKPNDLDIATDDKGLEVFYGLFEEFIISDKFGEVSSGIILELSVKGEEVEINSYNDSSLSKLDKIKISTWKDLPLPILPLKDAKEFYRQIEREEKVKIIVDKLKINQKKDE